MILKSRIILVLLVALSFCGSAIAQSTWVGSYEFDEDGGKTAGGSQIFIVHQLDILESDDGLIAMIESNGYQTSVDLVGTTKLEGNKLLIYFQSYGENNMFEPYKPGDLLFTLERKVNKEKTEILTTWDKFQPAVPKNEKSGKVYFRKVESND
jgi:hypothetical protein